MKLSLLVLLAGLVICDEIADSVGGLFGGSQIQPTQVKTERIQLNNEQQISKLIESLKKDNVATPKIEIQKKQGTIQQCFKNRCGQKIRKVRHRMYKKFKSKIRRLKMIIRKMKERRQKYRMMRMQRMNQQMNPYLNNSYSKNIPKIQTPKPIVIVQKAPCNKLGNEDLQISKKLNQLEVELTGLSSLNDKQALRTSIESLKKQLSSIPSK